MDNTPNGLGMREDFAPTGNGGGDFKYPHVKWGGGEIIIPIPAGTRYKISILPLNY